MAASGEWFRIWYMADSFRSGLSDCYVRIVTPSLTESGAFQMTEYEDEGIYFFDYLLPAAGTFLFIADCNSYPKKDAKLLHVDADSISGISSDITKISDILSGGWKLENNQLIIYKDDNETEVMRFGLYNEESFPTMAHVYERRRI